MCTIFGDTTASGFYTHASNKSPSDTNNVEDDENDDAMSSSPKTNETSMDGGSVKRKKKLDSSSGSRKRSNFSSVLASALETYSESSKRKIDLLEKSITTSSTHHLLKESVKALNELEGIDGEAYTKAINKFEQEVWRALFLEMPEHRRKDSVLNLK